MARSLLVIPGMTAEQMMTRGPKTCSPAEPLDRAAQVMWDFDVGVLPVVSEAGRLVGIITDRDICLATFTRGETFSDRAISDVMARDVLSCEPRDPMSDVIDKMRRHQIRRLPVVDGEHLVGIVSLVDLARAAAASSLGLSFEEVCRTLVAIGEHRAGRGAR